MQFKSKAQLAALKAAETNEPTTDVAEASPPSDQTPISTPPPETDPPAEDNFIQIVAPDYPKTLYDSAMVENEMRDFQMQLGNAMRPEIKTYTPPPVPKAIAEATRREMEAGRQRVAEFAAVEGQRRVIIANRVKEPWEGNTVEIFRPISFVPDPKAADRTGTLRVLSNR